MRRLLPVVLFPRLPPHLPVSISASPRLGGRVPARAGEGQESAAAVDHTTGSLKPAQQSQENPDQTGKTRGTRSSSELVVTCRHDLPSRTGELSPRTLTVGGRHLHSTEIGFGMAPRLRLAPVQAGINLEIVSGRVSFSAPALLDFLGNRCQIPASFHTNHTCMSYQRRPADHLNVPTDWSQSGKSNGGLLVLLFDVITGRVQP
jgi:hypothetical protein